MRTLIKWSVEEYHRMIAAGILANHQVELLAGDIVEMSPEGPIHASRVRKIAGYLRSLLGELAVISEAHPITLIDSEPQPDIAIAQPPESNYDNKHPQAEDIFWLIEVGDTTIVRDLDEKKRIYGNGGIREYWVIDINANSLKVFRQLQGNDYMLQQEVTQGNISPLSFPEVQVVVNLLLGRTC